MKTELERYEVNQLYLLNNGNFALIVDVDPVTRLSATENDRRVRVRIGHTRRKNEGMGAYDMIIENAPTNSSIVIGTSSIRVTMTEFRSMEAKYFGKLNEEATKRFAKVNADYINSL